MYFVVTVMLALLYAGIIILLQSLFTSLTGQTSPLALVISTLAIAGLFVPLRNRLQEFVDRRFYRRKFDARKALEAFSKTARSQVDIEQLNQSLVGIVSEAFKPETIDLHMVGHTKISAIQRGINK